MLGVGGQELQSGAGGGPSLPNEGCNAASLMTGGPNHQVHFRAKQAFAWVFSLSSDWAGLQ